MVSILRNRGWHHGTISHYVGLLYLWISVATTVTDAGQSGSKSISNSHLLKLCHNVKDIELGSEAQPRNHDLVGVIILLRHGDRGPLSEVRNMNDVYCGVRSNDSKEKILTYKRVVTRDKYKISKNSILAHKEESREKLLVPSQSKCKKGKLTSRGIVQLMKVGSIMRGAYYHRLFDNDALTKEKISIYSTNYDRTIQSVHAFLSTFLKRENFYRFVTVKESKSVWYCFENCTCPSADFYKKRYNSEVSKSYAKKKRMRKLVRKLSDITFKSKHSRLNVDPLKLQDGLLTFLCHKASTPSIKSRHVNEGDISAVFDFIDEETEFRVENTAQIKALKLKSYGFFKKIYTKMEQITSRKSSKLAIYSGHDTTITAISAALGILNKYTAHPPYASRFIIEVYSGKRKSSAGARKDHYFRLIFNGQDYTEEIPFCGHNSARDGKIFLRSTESIERHLKHDYFDDLRGKDFKDACKKKH